MQTSYGAWKREGLLRWPMLGSRVVRKAALQWVNSSKPECTHTWRMEWPVGLVAWSLWPEARAIRLNTLKGEGGCLAPRVWDWRLWLRVKANRVKSKNYKVEEWHQPPKFLLQLLRILNKGINNKSLWARCDTNQEDWITFDPRTTQGLGASTPMSCWKSACITWQAALCIHGSTSLKSTSCG